MRYDDVRLLLFAVISLCASARADDWPQWRGPTRDGVWRESGIVEKFSGPQIPIRWRVPIGGGYTGPTVADGRVFVMDRQGRPDEAERVLSFQADDGKSLWQFAYPCRYERIGYQAGPRASVSIADGRAYCLGAMGHFHCLEAATGRVLWKKDLQAEYRIRIPIWGMASAPLVDGELVIAMIGGADGACIVAWDRKTGREQWRAVDDQASYSAPIIIPQAGRRVLVCLTGNQVVGLDPSTGTLHWTHPFPPRKMIITVPTPVTANDRLFISGFYDGALMLRLRQDEPQVEMLWRRHGVDEVQTDALHAMISTPYLEGDYVYGVDSYGQLRCLDARTGDRIWEDLTAVPNVRWGTIHMVRNGQRMVMFNERGELILARLSPQGFQEISRARLIEPTTGQLNKRGGVCWSHPAYANRHVLARNDKELVCASLAIDSRPSGAGK